MENIAEVIKQVAEDAEGQANGPGRIRGQRQAGTATPAVLSVRLTSNQLAELAARAKAAGQPTSAYARGVLLDALGSSDSDVVADKLEVVLRKKLSPELLAPA